MWTETIKLALDAAEYHEIKAFTYANPKFFNYTYVLFHIRAYYWELLTIWDYILQIVNAETLNLHVEKIRSDFLEKLQNKMPEYKYLNELLEIKNADYFKRITRLRNYSHKWHINPNLVEYNEAGVTVISLENTKDPNLPRQINIDKNDLGFMKEVVENFTKIGLIK